MPLLGQDISKEVGVWPGAREKARGVQLDRREVENISDNVTSGQERRVQLRSREFSMSALAAQRVVAARGENMSHGTFITWNVILPAEDISTLRTSFRSSPAARSDLRAIYAELPAAHGCS